MKWVIEKQQRKINRIKSQLLKKINKVEKPLSQARLTKKIRETTQITGIRDERTYLLTLQELQELYEL